MKKPFSRKLAAAAAAMLATTSLASGALAQSWRDRAAQDLQAMHDMLRDNHPAAVMDRDNEQFRAWLAAGLADAQTKLAKVNDGPSYRYVMNYYTNGFRDANIRFLPSGRDAARTYEYYAADWTGFSTAYRNGGYYVAYVSPGTKGAPPVGARLIACDKIPAEQLAKQRLDLWEGDLTLEAEKVRTAPYLLWNRYNHNVGGSPISCDFDKKKRVKLQPTFTAEEERMNAWRVAVGDQGEQLGLEAFGQGGFWIKMPTLEDGAQWDAFFAQIEAQRAAIRQAPIVVIDLRGAEGYSSARLYGLANRLWEIDFVRQYTPTAGDIGYRVSPANRQFFNDVVANIQARGQSYEGEFQDNYLLLQAFDEAARAGQQTFRRPGRTFPAPATPPTNPMAGRVVVLTDYACASGCLNGLDLLLKIPNVVHAGTGPTQADSIYIEPTFAPLPSGQGTLAYGHKAWLDRPRQSRQVYTPTLLYTGDVNDQAGIRAWVQTAVAGGAAPAPAAQ
jgi:hypothetical protein